MAKDTEILHIVSNREDRRRLQMEIAMLPDGPHRVTIARSRPSKTMKQLGYYFSTHAQLFRQWLEREWGQNVTLEEAHLALKEKCLRKTVVNEQTGETLEYTGSVAQLNVGEMADYMENVANFIAEFTGIVVPEPRGPEFVEPTLEHSDAR